MRRQRETRIHVHAVHDPDAIMAQKIFRPPNTLEGQKIALSDHVRSRLGPHFGDRVPSRLDPTTRARYLPPPLRSASGDEMEKRASFYDTRNPILWRLMVRRAGKSGERPEACGVR